LNSSISASWWKEADLEFSCTPELDGVVRCKVNSQSQVPESPNILEPPQAA